MRLRVVMTQRTVIALAASFAWDCSMLNVAISRLSCSTKMFTCPTCRHFPQVLLLVQKQVDALSQIADDANSDDSDISREMITPADCG